MDIKIVKRGEIPIRLRIKIPYDVIVKGIINGHDVVVTGIKPQTAYYAGIKLSRMIGEEIVTLPVREDGEKGYLFTTKLSIKEWAKNQGINITD